MKHLNLKTTTNDTKALLHVELSGGCPDDWALSTQALEEIADSLKAQLFELLAWQGEPLNSETEVAKSRRSATISVEIGSDSASFVNQYIRAKPERFTGVLNGKEVHYMTYYKEGAMTVDRGFQYLGLKDFERRPNRVYTVACNYPLDHITVIAELTMENFAEPAKTTENNEKKDRAETSELVFKVPPRVVQKPKRTRKKPEVVDASAEEAKKPRRSRKKASAETDADDSKVAAN